VTSAALDDNVRHSVTLCVFASAGSVIIAAKWRAIPDHGQPDRTDLSRFRRREVGGRNPTTASPVVQMSVVFVAAKWGAKPDHGQPGRTDVSRFRRREVRGETRPRSARSYGSQSFSSLRSAGRNGFFRGDGGGWSSAGVAKFVWSEGIWVMRTWEAGLSLFVGLVADVGVSGGDPRRAELVGTDGEAGTVGNPSADAWTKIGGSTVAGAVAGTIGETGLASEGRSGGGTLPVTVGGWRTGTGGVRNWELLFGVVLG
jgi:hypothetical protein